MGLLLCSVMHWLCMFTSSDAPSRPVLYVPYGLSEALEHQWADEAARVAWMSAFHAALERVMHAKGKHSGGDAMRTREGLHSHDALKVEGLLDAPKLEGLLDVTKRGASLDAVEKKGLERECMKSGWPVGSSATWDASVDSKTPSKAIKAEQKAVGTQIKHEHEDQGKGSTGQGRGQTLVNRSKQSPPRSTQVASSKVASASAGAGASASGKAGSSGQRTSGTGARPYLPVCMQPMRWGLVPSWHKAPLAEFRLSTINARAETVTSKPLFKRPLDAGRRCVLLVDGHVAFRIIRFFSSNSHLSLFPLNLNTN